MSGISAAFQVPLSILGSCLPGDHWTLHLLEIPLLAGEQHIKNAHLTQLSAPRSVSSAPCRSEGEDFRKPLSKWKLCLDSRLSLGMQEQRFGFKHVSIGSMKWLVLPPRPHLPSGQVSSDLKAPSLQHPSSSHVLLRIQALQPLSWDFLWPLGTSQLMKISNNVFVLTSTI